jgi:hypothetical protein
MIATCRFAEISWKAELSAILERKTRTARKSLRALLLKRGPLSENAGAVAALGRTTSDFNAVAQFESEGGITVVFMA